MGYNAREDKGKRRRTDVTQWSCSPSFDLYSFLLLLLYPQLIFSLPSFPAINLKCGIASVTEVNKEDFGVYNLDGECARH